MASNLTKARHLSAAFLPLVGGFTPSSSSLLQRSSQLAAAIMSKRTPKRPSSDLSKFRETFKNSKHIVALTGAGISAESGVPTFRGSGGLWRTYRAQELATPEAFSSNPSRVWEFYSYRRELVLTKEPNAAHKALAEAEKRLKQDGRRLVIITQNIDELHRRAGSENVIELHGTLFKTSCMRCGDVAVNRDSPICKALEGKGNPDPKVMDSNIPVSELPHCKKPGCDGLVRPHVVWFGEPLEPQVLEEVNKELDACDLCLVIGTSSIVYPAAMFAPKVAARGVPVAEFNIETTPTTSNFGFHFEGPCGATLPEALKP